MRSSSASTAGDTGHCAREIQEASKLLPLVFIGPRGHSLTGLATTKSCYSGRPDVRSHTDHTAVRCAQCGDACLRRVYYTRYTRQSRIRTILHSEHLTYAPPYHFTTSRPLRYSGYTMSRFTARAAVQLHIRKRFHRSAIPLKSVAFPVFCCPWTPPPL